MFLIYFECSEEASEKNKAIWARGGESVSFWSAQGSIDSGKKDFRMRLVRACQLPVCRFSQRPAGSTRCWMLLTRTMGGGEVEESCSASWGISEWCLCFPPIPVLCAASRHLSSITICQQGPPCCLFPWQPMNSSGVSNTSSSHTLFYKKKSKCSNDSPDAGLWADGERSSCEGHAGRNWCAGEGT